MAMPMQMLDRATLVRRGAGLLAGGAVLGLAPPAFAAVPDEDLAYVRLLIGVELLEVDFQARALASGRLDPQTGRLLRTIATQEKAHLTGLSVLVTNAGQVPATADDVDFAYPNRTFASAAKIQRLADTIETLALGAYLGAVENVQTAAWRLPLGQIAATESRHVGALAAAAGKPVLGRAFAPSLQIDAVSAALDVYES
ncbi:MAG TPA: ferritin-like domain-containing protein [Gaiellaceae bacterium]|nr:ferritin-like domain-containing protein [Gaiellaceae bacterium]